MKVGGGFSSWLGPHTGDYIEHWPHPVGLAHWIPLPLPIAAETRTTAMVSPSSNLHFHNWPTVCVCCLYWLSGHGYIDDAVCIDLVCTAISMIDRSDAGVGTARFLLRVMNSPRGVGAPSEVHCLPACHLIRCVITVFINVSKLIA